MFLPLELTLRPSRIYAMLLVIAHGLACLAIWLASLDAWIQLLLTSAVLVGLIWTWRENSSGPVGLRFAQSGQVEILDKDWQPAEIQGQVVVSPWFVSMMFISKEAKARRILLWPDSTDANNFRKLRVWLRWGRPSQS